MEQPAYSGLVLHGRTHIGKMLKRIDVVEEIVREALGRFRMFLPGLTKDLFEIG